MAAFSDTAFDDVHAFSVAAFSFATAPPTPTFPNAPGRVYKGTYPYFKPRRKPYWEKPDPEEEELIAIIGIDLD